MRKGIYLNTCIYTSKYAERKKRIASIYARIERTSKDKRAESNWPHLSARSPPFLEEGGAGSWRLAEDLPGNLCPDRAQPRHASPPRFTTSPSARVHSPTRISTRTLFPNRPSQISQLRFIEQVCPLDSRLDGNRCRYNKIKPLVLYIYIYIR